jgi:hypothetical protein
MESHLRNRISVAVANIVAQYAGTGFEDLFAICFAVVVQRGLFILAPAQWRAPEGTVQGSEEIAIGRFMFPTDLPFETSAAREARVQFMLSRAAVLH